MIRYCIVALHHFSTAIFIGWVLARRKYRKESK